MYVQKPLKILLTLLPDGCCLRTALQQVIVLRTRPLERGITLNTCRGPALFAGSILSFIADMVGKHELMFSTGVGGEYASVYSWNSKGDLVKCCDQPYPWRSSSQVYKNLTELMSDLTVHGKKTETKLVLSALGYQRVMTPGWDLTWLKNSFIYHFALDHQHLAYHGNLS